MLQGQKGITQEIQAQEIRAHERIITLSKVSRRIRSVTPGCYLTTVSVFEDLRWKQADSTSYKCDINMTSDLFF